MDAGKLLLEFVLVVWLLVVWRRLREPVRHPRILWAMTLGALLTNVALTYLGIARSPAMAAAREQVGDPVLHGLLAFGVLKWTLLVYLVTRVALMITPRVEGGGFAMLRARGALGRAALAGVALGAVACAILIGANYLYAATGVLEGGFFGAAARSGVGWEVAALGGVRNLVGEEVLTRLGVQTLLLYSLREQRNGPLVALLASSLYFEVWHSGLTDFYFANFSLSCVLAWGYRRFGYEAAALGHAIVDWLGLALPLYLIAG